MDKVVDDSDEIPEKAEPTNEVGIRALKQNASAVIARVVDGEELIVTDRGRPVAQIIPIRMSPVERKLMEGLIRRPKIDLKDLDPPRPGGVPMTPYLLQMREEERY